VPETTSRILLIALVATASSLLLACASSGPGEGAGGTPVTDGAGLLRFFEPPPPGEGMVLIFRPPRFGRTGWATVYEDDEILALFGYSSYFAHVTSPGTHRYMVISEAADFLDVEVEAGHVYFAEIVPRTGAWRARFSLVPYPWGHARLEKLEDWLAKSKPVVPGSKEQEWHADHGGSAMEKRDAYLPKWLGKPNRPVLHPGDGATVSQLRGAR
jgi:hypothetical protein